MRIIPTTKTAVEKLRARAREIQRTENIAYAKARDRAAQDAGYDDWRHVQQMLTSSEGLLQVDQAQADNPLFRDVPNDEARHRYMQLLKEKGAAKVVPVAPPSKGDYFHSVEIEGNRFLGFISGGNLYLVRKRCSTDPWYVMDSSVHLRVAEIWKTGNRSFGEGPKEWHVCKYGPKEPCVYLGSLSKRGRQALAYEFGIPSKEDLIEAMPQPSDWLALSKPSVAERLFFLSPAFPALVKWCKAHPRKSRTMECQPHYLGDWKSAALAGQWPVNTDDDVSDEDLEKALWGPEGSPSGTPTLR